MKRVGKIDDKILWCLLLIAGVASVPLMTDYVFRGESLAGTLNQIRVLGQGLGSAFPLRVIPVSDYGYGAASLQANVFYLIPALLYRFGMELKDAYKWTLFLLNLATAGIAYLCFRRCCGSKWAGVIGSMLFTWCPGRCSEMYLAGDLGETAAWTFLPLILLGFRLLYKEERTGQDYRDAGGALSLGYSLVALSSTVVLFAVMVMTVVFLLVMGRETFRGKRLFTVIWAGVITFFVNAWFLVPALLRLREVPAVAPLLLRDVRGSGMYISQYLTVFNRGGDGERLVTEGLVGARAMGPGIAVMLLLAVFLWMVFVKEKRSDDILAVARERRFVGKCMGAAAILMFFSLNLFPWDLLQNRNMICSILLAVMHTPAKLGIVADVCLILSACIFFSLLSERVGEKECKLVSLVMVAIAFGTTQFLLGDILQTRSFLREAEVEALYSADFALLSGESIVWRLCEVVSAVALCACVALFVLRRRKKC